MSAFLGGISPRIAIKRAEESFRGLAFSELREVDLHGARENAREGGDSLAAHSRPCALGSVDSFVSHSWNDEATGKYASLAAWADEFASVHGREPILWLDKACIVQSDIEMSLKVLPIYLALTRTLLIVAGPTYHKRLWVGSARTRNPRALMTLARTPAHPPRPPHPPRPLRPLRPLSLQRETRGRMARLALAAADPSPL